MIQAQNSAKLGIKYVKNRSSSMNNYSIVYKGWYREYFKIMTDGNTAHALNLPRELPFQVFSRILQEVTDGLKIDSAAIDDNGVIPEGPDGIRLSY